MLYYLTLLTRRSEPWRYDRVEIREPSLSILSTLQTNIPLFYENLPDATISEAVALSGFSVNRFTRSTLNPRTLSTKPPCLMYP